jgi:hypothetical protein
MGIELQLGYLSTSLRRLHNSQGGPHADNMCGIHRDALTQGFK